ncbi:hypothetical protein [Methylococcus sp. EFPC2]|uniref:terpene synthase family protein n=1 Tax=Methylococcus sp. EFPC2 TaxID=2812648 RepID=UPI0019681381|nr:hypothetical protein [Methylococcus sp. EFPC2]QSA96520.1 hypothetical protein JWZ97_15035 [Methylococcus sp. EFPC2]
MIERLAVADLAIPASWPSTPNPYGDACHCATRRIALDLGLITHGQVRDFDRGQFALLSAYAYPYATPERLNLCNDWHSWLFFFDDQADEQIQIGKQPTLLRRYMEACLDLLRGGSARPNPTPLERYTLDIRNRMCRLMSASWMQRFADDVEDYLYKGTLEAARNWTDDRVPDLASYLVQRRYDSAVYTCQDLIELTGPALELGSVLGDPALQTLRDCCADVVGLSNDIFSYQKEVVVHRNPNNLLQVLMVNHRIDLDEAIHSGVALINAKVGQFIASEQDILSRYGHGNAALQAYLHGLKAWMRGNVLWSYQTGRYGLVDEQLPPRCGGYLPYSLLPANKVSALGLTFASGHGRNPIGADMSATRP